MSLLHYKDLIEELYTKKFYSANMISKYLTSKGYYCSRQGIILALRSWGYDTSKGMSGWVINICPECGRKFYIRRSEMRRVLEEGKSGRLCPYARHLGVDDD